MDLEVSESLIDEDYGIDLQSVEPYRSPMDLLDLFRGVVMKLGPNDHYVLVCYSYYSSSSQRYSYTYVLYTGPDVTVSPLHAPKGTHTYSYYDDGSSYLSSPASNLTHSVVGDFSSFPAGTSTIYASDLSYYPALYDTEVKKSEQVQALALCSFVWFGVLHRIRSSFRF